MSNTPQAKLTARHGVGTRQPDDADGHKPITAQLSTPHIARPVWVAAVSVAQARKTKDSDRRPRRIDEKQMGIFWRARIRGGEVKGRGPPSICGENCREARQVRKSKLNNPTRSTRLGRLRRSLFFSAVAPSADQGGKEDKSVCGLWRRLLDCARGFFWASSVR
jgi:hypothetical protein